MKNKPLLIVSAFITVFILTIGIGIVTKVSANNRQAAVSQTMDAATAFSEREQAYQQLIEQANQQLSLANQQIATLTNFGQIDSTAQPVPVYPISTDQAASIAGQLAGANPEKPPELVSYNGTPAYEVQFANGKVYVDATNGSVLYNGLQVQVVNVTPEQALIIAMNYLPTAQPVDIYYGRYNGNQVYVVVFNDGQSVYVDMNGRVVAVQMAAPQQPTDDHEFEQEDDDDEDD